MIVGNNFTTERADMENNLELQMTMKKYRIRQWQVAQKIGCSEAKVSKLLRTELSEDNYKILSEAINDLRENE
jgi:predicted XRE-type DNA-binding protein